MTPLLPSQKPLRLVVLGDNDFFRSLLCSHLKTNQSVSVEATASCDELLSRLNNKLDMLVVDESLEDCKLDELLTVLRLRADEVPVLVLTADSTSKRKLKLLELGATEVIIKNEDTNELLDHAIENQLGRIQLQLQVNQLKRRLEGVSLSSATPQVPGIAVTGDTEQTLETYTMGIIRHFLGKYNNNVVLVARKLDVGKSTIYRYLKENKLTLSGTPAPATADAIASRLSEETNFSVSGNPAIYTRRLDVEYVQEGMLMEPSSIGDDDARAAFTYLQRISKGNPAFVVHMTANFIHSMKTLIDQLESNLTTENRLRLINKLTKMKTSVDSMGMKSMSQRFGQLLGVLQHENDEAEVAQAMRELSAQFSVSEKAFLSEKTRLENAMNNITSGS